MRENEDVRGRGAGKPGTDPLDADIAELALRGGEGGARTPDYERIIRICERRIAELSGEVPGETGAEWPVRDGESDGTTVFCMDETVGPAMLYTEGVEWDGRYAGYSVFMACGTPYMYLGVDAEGRHLYAALSARAPRSPFPEAHLPPRTFGLRHTRLSGVHGSSLRIGYAGTLYGKHDYIITGDGRLLRYFGTRDGRFSYRDMSARRADGTYPGFLSDAKLENMAVQFTLW